MTRDGYAFACLYIAITRHFAKSGYDYFKYNGKVNYAIESYEGRKDIHFFEKRVRAIQQADWQDYIVANCMHEEKVWINHMTTTKMDQWRTHLDNMPKRFREDCEILSSYDLNSLIEGPGIPQIAMLAMRDVICKETLAIIDYFIDFMSNPGLTDTLAWPAYKRHIRKYQPFLTQKLGDMTYYSDIMREIFIN